MGGFFSWPSKPEDVPSIFDSEAGKYGSQEEAVEAGRKVTSAGVQIVGVILSNMDKLSATLPGPAALVGKAVSVLLVIGFDELLGEKKMDMGKVIEIMTQVIHDELTTVKVDEVEGLVEGTKRWVKVEFNHRLQAHWDPKDCYDEFSFHVEKLREGIDNVLMAARFKRKGLTLFMGAANLHLAMLLDLACLDIRVSNWKESAHLADFKQRAILYAKHAETTTDMVLNEREDKVDVDSYVLPAQTMHGGGGRQVWQWVDKVTDQRGPSTGNQGEAIDGYMVRRKAAREQLYKDLGKPKEAARKWRELKL